MIIVAELRHKYRLIDLLKLANIPRSTYYYGLKQIGKPGKYDEIKVEIAAIYHEHKGRYGYRRITMELRNRGYVINHKTVHKLMKQQQLKSLVRIKKYRSYKGEVGRIAPNLLERNFSATKPNQKWVTDVTEFSLFGSKIYLSPILDLYNGEIISYSITTRPTFRQIKEMLDNAFVRLPDKTKLILHSDQGWQYQMQIYQTLLKNRGIRQSMSRRGNCLDNAVMENFFGLLKSEFLYLQKFESLEIFIEGLKGYIDYYNNQRIKCKLKGLSPVQYRIQSSQSA